MNKNTLLFERYETQALVWPRSGRHILAQFDDDTIVVYQAYRPEIGHFAAQNGRFGGAFSFARMTWIKPNFLWMMFRSGWATKEGQEHILAIRLRRSFFDEVLEAAVPSTFDATRFTNHDEWKTAVAQSDVRLQWDPDHDPNGNCLERRAVQLGLRDEMLRRFGQDELLSIEDITPFVIEQREKRAGGLAALQTPAEEIYAPIRLGAASAVGIEVVQPPLIS